MIAVAPSLLSDRVKGVFGRKNRVGAANDGVMAAERFELTRRRCVGGMSLTRHVPNGV